MIDKIAVISWDMQPIYWNPYHPLIIHRSHHILFEEYNYCLSIEDNHTQGSLLLQQDPEILLHNSGVLKLIPCELDLISTTFSNTTILTNEIELPSYVNKFGFNLLENEDFTFPLCH